ncbi:putative RNA recognition motif domain, nucleotide-binding alpha-beta plait domain superfamily [Helianthus annuus]|uniref:Putative nucleotide-binding alpha-beta plait domain-containing protein n=1 Tax=Helianthus annuus TaxID=4232 RepID=A0A251TB41_HELAN|nr:zinc finger CCCH domain-containing protein 22 isoform X1 [Helianthus annuus]KAF5782883.1 putative RNA recognition motif domain, nucleotide-binding alpha-beta plait domain superfamily [Helianthus annuus]KAJ0502325.1 putative RNA recognition motif domain, nucleotide-binding alpha-beta plait domain superfamily [Helianthus annuus]KAJ0510362.1 putative RNA recognition motif domain, nucleotide-binding alpha-beta plait domain superfamily [Helianthus annuus]KAJ0518247.1 putative RNA recognition moti
MDSYEATRIVFTKLQTLDPQNASKIMGLLLIQDHGENEMIRLAFGPESLLHSVIIKARIQLNISSPPSPLSSQNLSRQNSGNSLTASRHVNSKITNLPSPLNPLAPSYDLVDEFRLLMRAAGVSSPNSPKPMNYLLQQSGSPRMATAATALMMGEEMNNFGRLRNDFLMGMVNPGSRQIYLTFPADSSFTEEDVSNYFSMYGPVQDVRIPYQQKRMFGFVSFVFAETVKLILAKGNPHFVCEARVLVKPYKEKGKVPDKFRKQPQQQMDSPIGFDSHDPFDLQHGGRMLINSQDLLWRKKLDEQADLQHAIELQNRRIMDLQLLDVKRNHHHQRALSTGAAIPSPTCYSPSYLNHSSVFGSDSSNISSPDSNDGLIPKLVPPITTDGVKPPLKASLNREEENEASDLKDSHEDGINLPESLEHNLPDNLFASPKKAEDHQTVFSNDKNTLVSSVASNSNLITSPLTSTLDLDLASVKSCYFEFPRFSSDHSAIRM